MNMLPYYLIYKHKYYNTSNYNFTCYFLQVGNLDPREEIAGGWRIL